MSTSVVLRGGLEGNSNNGHSAKEAVPANKKQQDGQEILKKARQAIAAKQKVSLSFLQTKPVVKDEAGRMTDEAVAAHANDIAMGAYEWTLNVGKDFLRSLDRKIEDIGPEVLLAKVSFGDKKNQEVRDEYELFLGSLQLYTPDNDDTLSEQAAIPGQEDYVKSLCVRVVYTTHIALIVDQVNYVPCGPEGKDELEGIVLSAKETSENNAKSVFTKTDPKNGEKPVWVFGKASWLAPKVFGRYREFAREKLYEAIQKKVHELAKDHAAVVQQQKQEVSASDENSVTPDELLFGDLTDVNNKTTVVSWKFQRRDNAIKLERRGEKLYIKSALGKPAEDLAAMKEKVSGEPFVMLKHILSRDGEHLCLEQEGRYKFDGYVAAMAMTCWIRTGFKYCLGDSRFLPKDDTQVEATKPEPAPIAKKDRPVKPIGELLTDKEFLFYRGIGEYDLVFETGFHYEPRGEDNKPTGQKFDITERATARVERKLLEDGKTKLALKAISSAELTQLLAAGGAIEGHEYFEGPKGFVLTLGISQAFGRLKKSEAEAS